VARCPVSCRRRGVSGELCLRKESRHEELRRRSAVSALRCPQNRTRCAKTFCERRESTKRRRGKTDGRAVQSGRPSASLKRIVVTWLRSRDTRARVVVSALDGPSSRSRGTVAVRLRPGCSPCHQKRTLLCQVTASLHPRKCRRRRVQWVGDPQLLEVRAVPARIVGVAAHLRAETRHHIAV